MLVLVAPRWRIPGGFASLTPAHDSSEFSLASLAIALTSPNLSAVPSVVVTGVLRLAGAGRFVFGARLAREVTDVAGKVLAQAHRSAVDTGPRLVAQQEAAQAAVPVGVVAGDDDADNPNAGICAGSAGERLFGGTIGRVRRRIDALSSVTALCRAAARATTSGRRCGLVWVAASSATSAGTDPTLERKASIGDSDVVVDQKLMMLDARSKAEREGKAEQLGARLVRRWHHRGRRRKGYGRKGAP